MLYIYDYLLDIIGEHLSQNNILADLDAQIGRKWHCSRYIAVFPKNWPDTIHYEYINGHWEIHFEHDYEHTEVEEIRKLLINKFKSDDNFGWHNWFGKKQGLLRLENEINNVDSFKSCFINLYNTTYDYINNNFTEKQPNLNYNNNNANITHGIAEIKYIPPKAIIQSIADLSFERLTIPEYQRPYKWTPKNVNQLIDDILYFKNSEEYRLGTLVVHIPHIPDIKPPFDIVDGQQRIITISLLLYLLKAENNFSALFNDELKQSIDIFLEKKQFHDTVSQTNIITNLQAIRQRLIDFDKKTVSFLLTNCKFVVITLHDKSEAFQFFDSQNARGKELAPHDLLKAFHLRAIPQRDEKDSKNIFVWENSTTSNLEALFLMLYRIKSWLKAKEGRYFTTRDVGVFKGLNADSDSYPYKKIYTIAQCYTELYNKDISRRLDKNKLLYPHQIDQVTINGSLFFDMVKYYQEMRKELEKIKADVNPDVINAVNSLNRGRGDQYIRLLFDTACLFFYDKFGLDKLDRAMDKIFAWAYGKRLKAYAIKLASIDNLARGAENESFFSMLHNAITPGDVLNWQVPVVRRNEIATNQPKTGPILNLLEKLRYVE